MKKYYFYAGHTPIFNGANTQFHDSISIEFEDGEQLNLPEVLNSICDYQAERLGVDSKEILLTAFNFVN